jgi:hypothetical protein
MDKITEEERAVCRLTVDELHEEVLHWRRRAAANALMPQPKPNPPRGPLSAPCEAHGEPYCACDQPVKLIYVAGPFSAPSREGIDANIAAAVALALEVAKAGAMPVCPHAKTSHPAFETLQPYTFWIRGTLALLRGCDALILCKGWELSSGTLGEIQEAKRLGIPVFSSIDDLRRWLEEAG